MKIDLFRYITTLVFIYTYGRLATHFLPEIGSYFINEPSNYQEKLEKPRILLHLVGLSFMHYMYYSYWSMENKNLLFQLIISAAFTCGFIFCQLSWTEKFQASFQKQIKKSPTRSTENFNISISDLQMTQLYNEMIRYDLIDQEKTSFKDFRSVLLEDWTCHHSKLHLKMDGPSCREFYDHLTKTFPINTLKLKDLFVTSGLILRPDGKKYNYNTLKNAPIRSQVSKNHETLVHIFKKLS